MIVEQSLVCSGTETLKESTQSVAALNHKHWDCSLLHLSALITVLLLLPLLF